MYCSVLPSRVANCSNRTLQAEPAGQSDAVPRPKTRAKDSEEGYEAKAQHGDGTVCSFGPAFFSLQPAHLWSHGWSA